MVLEIQFNPWMNGDRSDCRYDLRRAAESQSIITRTAGVCGGPPPRIMNYDVSAPSWCDLFGAARTENVLPLEQPGTSHGPSPTLCTAYCARSLKDRLAGARAALKEQGPFYVDALVLLAESLPVQFGELRSKVLAFATDTAMEPTANMFCVGGPPPIFRAAIRTAMAHLRNVERRQPGTAELERSWNQLQHIDPCLDAGGGLLRLHGLWASAWGSGEGPKSQAARQQLLPAIQELMWHGVDALMLMHYSLFFAAYVAKDGTGCGPDGAIVTRALAGIKDTDPEAWVPRLLAGLEVADPTVEPSFILESKQAAMACCTFLGKYWMRACGGRTMDSRICVWAPALARLLAERALQAPLLGGVPELLRTAVVTFNIDPCFHEPPSWHVVVTEAEAALKRTARPSTLGTLAMRLDNSLKGAWALTILLMDLARGTHNLPPVRHWVFWKSAEAVWQLCSKKGKAVPRDPQTMAAFLSKHALEVYQAALSQLQLTESMMPATDTRVQQVGVIKGALKLLFHCTLRWLWQAGKADKARHELNKHVATELESMNGGFGRALVLPDEMARAQALIKARQIALETGDKGVSWANMVSAQRTLQVLAFLRQEAGEQAALADQAQSAEATEAMDDPLDVSQELMQLLQDAGADPSSSIDAAGPMQQEQLAQLGVEAGRAPHATAAAVVSAVPGTADASGAGSSRAPGTAAGPASRSSSAAGGTDADAESGGAEEGHGGGSAGKRKGAKKPRGPCAQCGVQPAKTQRCGGCGEVNYCNKECQRLHWQQHKQECSRALLKDGSGSGRDQ